MAPASASTMPHAAAPRSTTRAVAAAPPWLRTAGVVVVAHAWAAQRLASPPPPSVAVPAAAPLRFEWRLNSDATPIAVQHAPARPRFAGVERHTAPGGMPPTRHRAVVAAARGAAAGADGDRSAPPSGAASRAVASPRPRPASSAVATAAGAFAPRAASAGATAALAEAMTTASATSPRATLPTAAPAVATESAAAHEASPSGAAPVSDVAALPPLPRQAVAVPAPARLHYRLQAGARRALATFVWAPDVDGTYHVALEWVEPAAGPSRAVPRRSSSEGRWSDDDGVVPQRHLDALGARSVRALTFDAAAQRVHASSRADAQRWAEGWQDGVSWLAQWASIVQAAGQRAASAGLAPHAPDVVVLGIVDAQGRPARWTLRRAASSPDDPPRTRRWHHRGDDAAEVEVWMADDDAPSPPGAAGARDPWPLGWRIRGRFVAWAAWRAPPSDNAAAARPSPDVGAVGPPSTPPPR